MANWVIFQSIWHPNTHTGMGCSPYSRYADTLSELSRLKPPLQSVALFELARVHGAAFEALQPLQCGTLCSEDLLLGQSFRHAVTL